MRHLILFSFSKPLKTVHGYLLPSPKSAERMGAEVSMAVDGSPDAFGSEPENIEELIEEDIRTGMHT